MKDYQKIYEGNMIEAQKLVSMLKDHRISPVIKDETESGRLAGFAPNIIGNVQVFVHKDELSVTKYVIASLEPSEESIRMS
ncbi:putative signal transducing protein [Pustulibacterium marinum]|nr:DUF2007 domain-containing protein [Pustulibacterium marinum]